MLNLDIFEQQKAVNRFAELAREAFARMVEAIPLDGHLADRARLEKAHQRRIRKAH